MASLNKEEQKTLVDDMALVNVVKAKVKEFETFIGDWRDEAKLAFDMVAGHQWTEEEQNILKSQERVPVVFNRIAAFVRGVCGMEVSNRQSVKYLPREIGDIAPNEVMNSAAQWVRDGCNAEDEESESFRDMVICGLGCTETRLDYDSDPEGTVFVERRDPLRVGYDPTSCKKNVQDATWVYAFADYTKATLEAKWPDNADEVMATMFPDEKGGIGSDFREQWYEGNDTSAKNKDSIRVIQFQYYKDMVFYRIQDPTGQTQEIPAERFKKLKKVFDQEGVKYVKIKKKQYRQAFVAGDVLLDDIPLPADEFTLKFLTGIRDRNKNYFYGMVRDAIDPQKWSNKFFSLAIDILATNPKGGLMAETDAFEDRQKAEEDWSNPRNIVWMRPGALRDNKVQQRHPSAPPPALDAMMGFAVSSMPQIMGINMEFLGLADRAQAGILESQRKQSAITTLAEFFSSLTLYRKVQGKCLMSMILKYLTDGRLIRIVGQENAQYVPLVRQPGFDKFDVVVDEAPNAPDVKARTWQALENLLPQLIKMGTPIPPEVVDYMPIPVSLSAKWKAELVKAQSKPKMSPEHEKMMQDMQKEMQTLQQENQQLKQQSMSKMAELQMQRQEAEAKLALQREESAAQIELKRQVAELDAQIELAKIQAENELKREQALADIKLKIESMSADNEFKKMDMLMSHYGDENEESEHEEPKENNDQITNVISMLAEQNKAIIESMNRPKRVVRGKDGKVEGVE